ncbi:hypothetical protein GH714_031016 [Hevea brasiliensis]|uniref:Uncharacterized protein n=1 Tax=Hevea brasiliensis TaxID=3981 RepID=A0A6A6N7J7_HEVBR|nr:hypothetical protein GH714_031016 [Hevea brasiliensis]
MRSKANKCKVGYGGIGGGTAQLPKSFSVNSSRAVDDDEEFKKLQRLLSAKGISEVETYLHCRQGDGRSYSEGSSWLKRSYSVGVGKIGRIDEDRACSFREDDNDAQANLAGYGSIGGGTAQLPKSFSVNSSRAVEDQGLKELLQLLSAKGISKVETYLPCRQGDGRSYSKGSSGMKRSYSVG